MIRESLAQTNEAYVKPIYIYIGRDVFWGNIQDLFRIDSKILKKKTVYSVREFIYKIKSNGGHRHICGKYVMEQRLRFGNA